MNYYIRVLPLNKNISLAYFADSEGMDGMNTSSLRISSRLPSGLDVIVCPELNIRFQTFTRVSHLQRARTVMGAVSTKHLPSRRLPSGL